MVRPTPSGAVVFHILGEVDRSHSTTTDFVVDGVAVPKCFLQTAKDIFGHVMRSPGPEL